MYFIKLTEKGEQKNENKRVALCYCSPVELALEKKDGIETCTENENLKTFDF